jgi:2-iminobutanoate/2-iminopropanoate deaminase
MNVQYLNSDSAPRAIGPYSHAALSGGFVFAAGQIPMDPATMELVPGDIRVQAAKVLDNLTAVLTSAGCTWADVVKTTIFLTDMNDFAAVNEVYGARVGAAAPARSTIAVAGLPRGARVEMECIARTR